MEVNTWGWEGATGWGSPGLLNEFWAGTSGREKTSFAGMWFDGTLLVVDWLFCVDVAAKVAGNSDVGDCSALCLGLMIWLGLLLNVPD